MGWKKSTAQGFVLVLVVVLERVGRCGVREYWSDGVLE